MTQGKRAELENPKVEYGVFYRLVTGEPALTIMHDGMAAPGW
jgi:hypothetical protein